MRSTLLVVTAVVVVLAACAEGPPAPGPPEPIAKTASPIINGQLDTTHQAVVAILSENAKTTGLCSGAIVKVDLKTHIGWVLTAAHCVKDPPVQVFQGNDFTASGALVYDVVDFKADARYNAQTGSPYDYAVVRIAGVDASTPILPMVGVPDGLVVGTPVVSVGYGQTSETSTTDNSIRRRVAKTLNQVGQAQISFDMRNDGICQGDSGGPVLVSVSGVEKIAGVHSYVQGGCGGLGVSERVSFNLPFINGELAKASPPEDCGLCEKIAYSANGTCAVRSRSCFADKDCKGFNDCLTAGGSRASCATKFPKGEGPLESVGNCACTTACTTTCGAGPACKSVPKCAYKLPAGDCATCTEGACCAEAIDCASDGTCFQCLKNKDADPACATNAPRKKLATCVASKCAAQCAGSGLETGADPVTPEADPNAPPGGKTTTTTTEGCSVSATATPRSSSGYVLAGLAVVVATMARRRRRAT